MQTMDCTYIEHQGSVGRGRSRTAGARAARPGPASLAGLALLVAALAAPALAGSLSPDLAALDLVAGGEGEVAVIVTYRHPPGDAESGKIATRGGHHLRTLHGVRAVAADIPVAALRELAGDPEVESISVDERVRVATDVAVPALGASLVRQVLGEDGAGVRVAVVDSGIEPVKNLGVTRDRPLGRIVAWTDLVDPNRTSPTDPFGHGTHVAGIIAADLEEIRDPGGRVATYGGVAPQADLVSVRVLDRDGEGRTSDLIAGIDWVVDHASALGIRVLNLSLGHAVHEPAATDPLVRACERAWDAGLLVVVSAGNGGREGNGYGTITSPGNSERVLTVGALNDGGTWGRSDDVPTSYSSRGPARLDGTVKPDLLAPGDNIVSLRVPHSTLDRELPDNRVGSSSRGAAEPEFFRLSGSSMAAAMASGGAALLLAADPSLDPDTLKARLMRSAEKRTEDLYVRGAGSLDLAAALEDTGRAAHSTSPHAERGDATVRVTDLEPWGPDWEMQAVYGGDALWQADAAWDLLGAAPGDEASSAQPVLWQVPLAGQRGTSLVWERAQLPTAQSVVWQRGGPVQSESVVWQIDGPIASESVVWQLRPGGSDDPLSAESVVWQIGPTPADDTVGAESVVWQIDGGGLAILGQGDGRAAP
jgi:serine protease AprX